MRILRFNEVDRQRAAGQTGDGQRERRPGHPAADDQHAHDWRAAAISASISSRLLHHAGSGFSLPSSVITMSSSIRMPMPRYCAGTSASVAILQSRLDGQHHSRLQDARTVGVVITDIVHIQTQPVAQAMHKVRAVGVVGDKLVNLAFQDPPAAPGR